MSILIWIGPYRTLNPIQNYFLKIVCFCVFFCPFVSFSTSAFVPELEKFNADNIKYEGLPEIVANLAGKQPKIDRKLLGNEISDLFYNLISQYCTSGIGHSELSIVSDFATPSSIQEHFFSTLNERKVSYATYNVEELRYVVQN